MLKKLVIAALCLAPVIHAQTPTHQPIASQFGNWRAFPQSGPYSNTNLVAGANVVSVNPCNYAAGGISSIPVFAASTPIKIVDPGNPSVDETITPTSITNGGCTATLTTSNAHTSPYYFTSGTFGLQEALNSTTLSGQINNILLDTAWHQAGGNQQTVYNAAGNYNTPIDDVTIAPDVTYRWSGTHYIQTYAVNGFTTAVAAGVAAGTSPTISPGAGASGNLLTVNLTTGTATTTGALFTVTNTTPTPNSSGNLSCTAQSVGANPFPVALTQTPASATVATFTVAVAPPVSTAYVFAISCN